MPLHVGSDTIKLYYLADIMSAGNCHARSMPYSVVCTCVRQHGAVDIAVQVFCDIDLMVYASVWMPWPLAEVSLLRPNPPLPLLLL